MECGEFNFRRILHELNAVDIRVWAALFRLQDKESQKVEQAGDATAARRAAERRLAP